MIKIIMDSGKEYEVNDYNVQNVIDECYETKEMPSPFGQGAKFEQFVSKFIKISDKITINTGHISSIEECNM